MSHWRSIFLPFLSGNVPARNFSQLIAPSHEDEDDSHTHTRVRIYWKLMTSYSNCYVRCVALTLEMGKNTKSFHSQRKHPKYSHRRRWFDLLIFISFACAATTRHFNVTTSRPCTNYKRRKCEKYSYLTTQRIFRWMHSPSHAFVCASVDHFCSWYRFYGYTAYTQSFGGFSIFFSTQLYFLLSSPHTVTSMQREMLLLNVIHAQRKATTYRWIGSLCFGGMR